MNRISSILYRCRFAILIAPLLLIASCDDDDDDDPTPTPTPTQNIVEIAQGNDDFSILVEALTETNLAADLSGNGPFTVLAPENAAFEEIFNDLGISDNDNDGSLVDDYISSVGEEEATQRLMYHVLPNQDIRSQDISSGTTAATLAEEGDENLIVQFTILVNDIFVNVNSLSGGGQVVNADILASNGVIHRIDGVLDPNESPGQETIAGTLQNFSQFTTFVEVLEEAQMLGDLDVSQTFTVFAPNDEAFNELFDAENIMDADGDGSRADDFVDAVGDANATDILYYHVIDGATLYADDIDENNYYETGSNAAPGGNPLSLLLGTDETGQSVEVNGGSDTGAEIISADILATNGIIHEIDAALALPSVADLVAANDNLSSLTNALQETNLTETLGDSESTYTVFAPNDDGFAAIINTYNGLSEDQKTDVLTYHVLTEQVTSSEIMEGPATTLNGQTINFTLSGGGVSITDSEGGTSEVIEVDVRGTNGVVHIVSDVLLPPL